MRGEKKSKKRRRGMEVRGSRKKMEEGEYPAESREGRLTRNICVDRICSVLTKKKKKENGLESDHRKASRKAARRKGEQKSVARERRKNVRGKVSENVDLMFMLCLRSSAACR